MTYLTEENLTFKIPLTADVYRLAEKLSREQKDPQKARQVYLNSLAVSAVDFYCQCMEVETEVTARESENIALRSLMDIADLEIKGWGKLECRPVLPGVDSCPVPSEVLENRVGYVVVEINEETNRATLLGFAKNASAGILEVNRLESLESLIDRLPETSLDSVNLIQWFSGVFEEGWQAVNKVISPQLRPAFMNLAVKQERCKLVDIGLDLAGHSVALIMTVEQLSEEGFSVWVQVYPTGNQRSLPPHLNLAILDESGAVFKEVTARSDDECIRYKFEAESGDKFGVKVALGDASVTENFQL